MTKQLTTAQQDLYAEIQRCFLTMSSTLNVEYSRYQKSVSRAFGSRYKGASFIALIDAGLIVRDNGLMYSFRLTDAGKAERAAATESETVANLRQALHEAATGQTEPVATLWDGVYDARSDVPRAEYDTLAARLARAEAALREAMERMALSKKYLEDIPEGKIDALNNQMVLECVNFAYSYLVDAPAAIKQILDGTALNGEG